MEKYERFGRAAALLVGGILAYSLFHKYFIAPNSYMYAFGGDALAIYYDIVFHTTYGHSTQLEAMNYPCGEFIFMTDAQGVLSMILMWVNHYLFDISGQVLGIVHVLNLFSIFIGIWLLFLVFKKLSITNEVAAVFSPLIVLMSPQMFRFGGHFGLAYPFLIPLTIYWCLDKLEDHSWKLRDVWVFVVLVLFTLNNPYSGATALAPVFFVAIATVLVMKKDAVAKAFAMLLFGALCLFIPYAVLHFGDSISDRVQQQWGFFFYNSTLPGILYPENSLLRMGLEAFSVQVPPAQIEARQNLGLAVIVGVFVLVVRALIIQVRDKKRRPVLTPTTRIFSLAAIGLFLFTSETIWQYVDQAWMEENMGFLLMFKAMARLNWASYFLVGIVVVQGFDVLFRHGKTGKAFVGCMAVLWVFEINSYVRPQFADSFHTNFLIGEHREQIAGQARDHGIDTASFQGILVLPKMVAWSDLFLSEIQFNAQFYSMRLSLATGLPLISANLSRMSTSQAASIVQMVSHPIVQRERLKDFPNQKDVLLLIGKGPDDLAPGEQYVISISDTLADFETHTLMRLPLHRMDHAEAADSARTQYAKNPAPPLMHFGFDGGDETAFAGRSSFVSPAGQNILIDTTVGITDTLIFSAWTRIDHRKYGMGSFEFQVMDSSGQILKTETLDSRWSNDVQRGWLRTEWEWIHPPNGRVKVVHHSNRRLLVDEVWIYPANEKRFVLKKDGTMMMNGYIVE